MKTRLVVSVLAAQDAFPAPGRGWRVCPAVCGLLADGPGAGHFPGAPFHGCAVLRECRRLGVLHPPAANTGAQPHAGPYDGR